MAKNSIIFDFRDNPDLKALIGGKQPGDKLTLEIDVMVTSVDEETFEATIESISTDSEEEDSAEVDAESPVNAILVVSKKKKSVPADAEDEADAIADEETEA